MNKEKLGVECVGEIDINLINDNFCQILLNSLLTLLKQQKSDA